MAPSKAKLYDEKTSLLGRPRAIEEADEKEVGSRSKGSDLAKPPESITGFEGVEWRRGEDEAIDHDRQGRSCNQSTVRRKSEAAHAGQR